MKEILIPLIGPKGEISEKAFSETPTPRIAFAKKDKRLTAKPRFDPSDRAEYEERYELMDFKLGFRDFTDFESRTDGFRSLKVLVFVHEDFGRGMKVDTRRAAIEQHMQRFAFWFASYGERIDTRNRKWKP